MSVSVLVRFRCFGAPACRVSLITLIFCPLSSSSQLCAPRQRSPGTTEHRHRTSLPPDRAARRCTSATAGHLAAAAAAAAAAYRYVEINPYETAADGSDTKTALSLDEKRNRYPEWIECSPRGLVPALEDGGVGVADSMVCLEYLEEVYRDRPLLPGAPGERARLRFWAVYANEKIIPHYYRLLMSQDTEGRERARAGLVDGLTEFACQMDPTGPYFMGAQFTWADLALAPWYERLRTVAAAYRSFEMPVDGVATARLERWYEAVRAWPSVAATLANEAELVRNYAGYADDSATSDASRQFRGAV